MINNVHNFNKKVLIATIKQIKIKKYN